MCSLPSWPRRAVLALVVVSFFGLTASRGAQEPQKGPSGKLDLPALDKLLQDLGHEIKYYSKTIPSIVLERRNSTYPTSLIFSNDMSMIYLETNLFSLANGEEVNAAALLGLLRATDSNLPAYFSYLPKTRRFVLIRPVRNSDLTPASLRKQLLDHTDMLADTAPRWRKSTLLTYVPPRVNKETEADLARLTGTWVAFERELNGVKSTPDSVKSMYRYVFKDGKAARVWSDDKTIDPSHVLHFDASLTTKTVDLLDTLNGGVQKGIYKLEEGVLWFCFDDLDFDLGPTRPREFVSTPGRALFKYRKQP